MSSSNLARYKARRRAMSLHARFYRQKFRWSHACVYCGEHATELDHVYPVSLTLEMDLQHTWQRRALGQGLSLVPACRECNSLAGGQPFTNIRAKRKYVQAKLRKKYRKVLETGVAWDDDELAELGPNLRRYVTSRQNVLSRVRSRVVWPNYRELAGVLRYDYTT